MDDLGHKWTEEELAALERRIRKVYRQARKEVQKTIDDYFSQFIERDSHQQDLLAEGKITVEQYKQWRLNQIGRGKRFEALRDKLAERYTKANEVAISYVNDASPGVYSLNRNYAAYTIERVAGDVGFDLWDEQTVKRMIVEEPDVMPYYPPQRAVNRGIDLAYGKRQISAAVTSGILQGKSIGKISSDLQDRIQGINRTSAVRAARTAMTAAQNAGRMDSYAAADKMGIQVRKRWIATKDSRTRHSHGMVDGETIGYRERFSNGLMFPGDPDGRPGEVYNCRCTIRTVEKEGIEAEPRQMRVRDPETGRNVLVNEMTYREWSRWKSTLKSNNPDDIIEITDQSVASIKEIRSSVLSAAASKKIKLHSQELLKIAKANEKGTEIGTICDMNGDKKWTGVGKDGEVSIPVVSYPCVVLHNHPDGNVFSGQDLENFVFRSDISGMLAVGNDGSVYSAFKTEAYDGFLAYKNLESLKVELKKYTLSGDKDGYIKEIRAFLKAGEAFGLEFIEKRP